MAERSADAGAFEAALRTAEEELDQAQAAHAAAERTHAAVAVAQDLEVGADCPVCLRPVTTAAAPPDASRPDQARAAVDASVKAVRKARADRDQAAKAAAVAAGDLETTFKQGERIAAVLADASSESEVRALLEAIAVADQRVGKARAAARDARTAAAAAERQRAGLDEEERRARAALGSMRDSVVQLGAPAVDGGDLAAAWDALTAWATAQAGERARRLADARARRPERRGSISPRPSVQSGTMLATHGVDVVERGQGRGGRRRAQVNGRRARLDAGPGEPAEGGRARPRRSARTWKTSRSRRCSAGCCARRRSSAGCAARRSTRWCSRRRRR